MSSKIASNSKHSLTNLYLQILDNHTAVARCAPAGEGESCYLRLTFCRRRCCCCYATDRSESVRSFFCAVDSISI